VQEVGKATVEQARRELAKAEEFLFRRCKSSKIFAIRFDAQIKRVARKYGLEQNEMWKKYLGEDLVQRMADRKSTLLRKVWLKVKIIEAKTPRSAWWLAFRKKKYKKLGWRCIKLPKSYCYVRVPLYKDPLMWARGKCRLLQDSGARVYYKEFYKRWKFKRGSLIDKLPVAGDFWKANIKSIKQKEIEEQRIRYSKLRRYMEKLFIRRVHKILDKKGGKLGFKQVTKVSNPYTEKSIVTQEWVCTEGYYCPCGFYRECITFKTILKGGVGYEKESRKSSISSRRRRCKRDGQSVRQTRNIGKKAGRNSSSSSRRNTGSKCGVRKGKQGISKDGKRRSKRSSKKT